MELGWERAIAVRLIWPSAAIASAIVAAVVGGSIFGVELGTTAAAGPPAFPGALGYGATTPGGRGGQVLVVTSLADDGPGTLRWALETTTGPRIVVFAVGGVIDLERQIDVGGRVTVAGQTAPGDGIVVRGARLHVVGDDVVIRGMKLRPGSGPGQNLGVRDAISVGREDGTVRRVMIDGNSLAWAPDENAATWYDVSDVSYTNNIIAEGLAVPGTGNPSMGLLVGDGARRVTVARNLFANNTHRNPQVKGATEIEVVNNLVYNYGHNGTATPPGLSEPISLHIVGNLYVPGADTVDRAPVRLGEGAEHRYYLHDNLGPTRPHEDLPQDLIAGGDGTEAIVTLPIFETSGITPFAAEAAAWRVPATAGARAQGLDPTDARIIDGVLTGHGRRLEAPPAAAFDVPTARADWTDTDADGMPDPIEAAMGTDPSRPDAGEDPDGDGYTNVEDYVNAAAEGQLDAAGPCSGEPAAEADEAHIVEAEAMELIEGFAVDENPHASGAVLIRSDGAALSRARHLTTVPGMHYDLIVRYFDENDGVSVLGLRVDGVLTDLWAWDEDRGTAYVEGASRTMRRIPCVALEPGTEVELFGAAGEDEPLRVDAIELRPSATR